jgi:hypothetical protein
MYSIHYDLPRDGLLRMLLDYAPVIQVWYA